MLSNVLALLNRLFRAHGPAEHAPRHVQVLPTATLSSISGGGGGAGGPVKFW